jgi:hypothetical protein
VQGLRSELIAILTKIYFSSERKGSLTEDMADAVLDLLEKRK